MNDERSQAPTWIKFDPRINKTSGGKNLYKWRTNVIGPPFVIQE